MKDTIFVPLICIFLIPVGLITVYSGFTLIPYIISQFIVGGISLFLFLKINKLVKNEYTLAKMFVNTFITSLVIGVLVLFYNLKQENIIVQVNSALEGGNLSMFTNPLNPYLAFLIFILFFNLPSIIYAILNSRRQQQVHNV